MTLRELLFKDMIGCMNKYCIVTGKRKGGMHTNSTCTCLENMTRSQLTIIGSRLKLVSELNIDEVLK